MFYGYKTPITKSRLVLRSVGHRTFCLSIPAKQRPHEMSAQLPIPGWLPLTSKHLKLLESCATEPQVIPRAAFAPPHHLESTGLICCPSSPSGLRPPVPAECQEDAVTSATRRIHTRRPTLQRCFPVRLVRLTHMSGPERGDGRDGLLDC